MDTPRSNCLEFECDDCVFASLAAALSADYRCSALNLTLGQKHSIPHSLNGPPFSTAAMVEDVSGDDFRHRLV